jgi:hypothetical protein
MLPAFACTRAHCASSLCASPTPSQACHLRILPAAERVSWAPGHAKYDAGLQELATHVCREEERTIQDFVFKLKVLRTAKADESGSAATKLLRRIIRLRRQAPHLGDFCCVGLGVGGGRDGWRVDISRSWRTGAAGSEPGGEGGKRGQILRARAETGAEAGYERVG